MRIAVIGTGHIGGTLGGRWRAAGHDVVYGSRQGTGEGPGGAPLAPIGDAVQDADVVVLAIPGGAVAGTVGEYGAALDGKTIVDATNNMGGGAPDSRAAITAAVPNVRYVRAFNTLGWENFADPLPGSALFFAAEPSARATAEELIQRGGAGAGLRRGRGRHRDGRRPAPPMVRDRQAARRQPQGRPEHHPVGVRLPAPSRPVPFRPAAVTR